LKHRRKIEKKILSPVTSPVNVHNISLHSYHIIAKFKVNYNIEKAAIPNLKKERKCGKVLG